MTTLDDKVAVITGGASGIGLAIARAGVAAGMQVVLADIEEAPLAAACEELGATGVRTDVADPGSVAALAEEVREVHGTCDLVFNNAGVGGRGRIIDSTLDDWNWVIDVNLRGVVHVIDAFLPMLLDNPGGGHLINTASLAGLMALVSGPYTATKYAVVGISETLRRELADTHVRVSVLCPGFVRTNIMKSERNRPRSDDAAPGAERRNNGHDFEAISNAKVMDAAEIAAMTLAAVQNDEFWIIGDPELFRLATPRYDELRAIADRGA